MNSLIGAATAGIIVALLIVIGMKLVERKFKVRYFGFGFTAYFAFICGLGWLGAYIFFSITNPAFRPKWQQSLYQSAQYYGFVLGTMCVLALLQRFFKPQN